MKKLICLLLAAAVFAACLCGCAASDKPAETAPAATPEALATPEPEAVKWTDDNLKESVYGFLGKDYDNLLTADLICHGVPSETVFKKYIQEHEKETGKKVIALHPMNDSIQICDDFVRDASVYDFLALIKNADCILTNSFHGLAFSYIFRKKVYCVHHSSLSSRQSELMEKSGFVYENCGENVYYMDTAQATQEMKNFVGNSHKCLEFMVKEL